VPRIGGLFLLAGTVLAIVTVHNIKKSTIGYVPLAVGGQKDMDMN
jgi:hypothetical protein